MHFIKNIFKPFGQVVSSIFLVELILFLTIAYLSYAAENKRLIKEKVEARNEWNKKAQIGSVSTEISRVVVDNENALEKFKEIKVGLGLITFPFNFIAGLIVMYLGLDDLSTIEINGHKENLSSRISEIISNKLSHKRKNDDINNKY